jgi:hypothetical protein
MEFQPTQTSIAVKKTGYVRVLLFAFFLLPHLFLYGDYTLVLESPQILFFMYMPFGMLLWAYLDIYYRIMGDVLTYKCAFLKGTIPIKNINKVMLNDTLWVGTKPAVASGGIIIVFNKFDEVYLAPESNDELVNALLAINPDIEVVREKTGKY